MFSYVFLFQGAKFADAFMIRALNLQVYESCHHQQIKLIFSFHYIASSFIGLLLLLSNLSNINNSFPAKQSICTL